MSRAGIVLAALVALGLAGLAAYSATNGFPGSGVEPEAADLRPNFVVVMTDDQGAGRDLEIMEKVQTELADQGVTFDNFYATFPLCCPSRATFLTGQYAHNTGVESNRRPDGGLPSFDDSGSLAPTLNGAGYRTKLVGKYLNGYPAAARQDPEGSIPEGWDEWFAVMRERMFNWEVNDNGDLRDYGDADDDYQTDVYADQAVDFIDRSSELNQPFFLYVATDAPHLENARQNAKGDKLGGVNPRPAPRHEGAFDSEPLPMPPSFNEPDISDKPLFTPRTQLTQKQIDRLTRINQDRLASLLAVDDLVGDVVDALGETGELDNTYVIFTSDNGYLKGEHRLLKKSYIYQEAARVPMVIRGPGIPAGEVRDQLTGNIDLMPTMLATSGAETELVQDGISLLPLADSASVEADRDILLQDLKYGNSEAIRSGPYLYAEHDTFSESDGPDEFELYDLESDPFQLDNLYEPTPQNLAKVPMPVRRSLERKLHELIGCAGDDCQVNGL